ncbi:hypothetical protein JB92DRAFT_1217197 [Gautieria morchelliformis]|nr:hypothetical protein JB92DRAFT_1217197 [Gautieria morchelliformis]
MELCHYWARFNFTPDFSKMFSNVSFLMSYSILRARTRSKWRSNGDDFYEWLLGPRIVYTSAVVRLDLEREETLEELQDNRLTLVREAGPRTYGLLTLVAAGARSQRLPPRTIVATSVASPLQKQPLFGNERIATNGGDPDCARILSVIIAISLLSFLCHS